MPAPISDPPPRESSARPASHRRLALPAALLALAAAFLLGVLPSASAASSAPGSGAARVLADGALPAPSATATPTPASAPAPGASSPGIGLGSGAPTGAAGTATLAPTDAGGGGSGSSDPSFFDIPGQITKAINDWFASLVTDALNPMLRLLGSTLLGTPDVTHMARVASLWAQMALLANSLYVLLVLAGAVIVMSHETLQSLYSVKEIAPRAVIGMIAGNASLGLLALMIHLADALAKAVLGGSIDPNTAGTALAHQLTGALSGSGIFLSLLGLGAAVMLIAVLLTYIVRVALTVLLAVLAPLALALHALPQSEGLARLWWRAVTGCLVIQLGQSLVFVIALQVMLDPTGQTALGFPTGGALVDVLVFLALTWTLVKIPFWVSKSVFGGGGSRLMSMAKAYVAYKTLGLAKGLIPKGGRKSTAPNRPTTTWRASQVHPPPPPRPVLGGPRRALPPAPPGTRPPGNSGPPGGPPPGANPTEPSAGERAVARRDPVGALPPVSERPALTSSREGPFMRNGRRKPRHQQLTLPIPVPRVPRPTPPAPAPGPGPVPVAARRASGQQLPLFPRSAANQSAPAGQDPAAPVGAGGPQPVAPSPASRPRPAAARPQAPNPTAGASPPRPVPAAMPRRAARPAGPARTTGKQQQP